MAVTAWSRFLIAAVLFHAGFLGVCLVLFRRWRSRGLTGLGPWLSMLAMDALRVLVAAVHLASLAAVVGPPGGFTFLRFLAQGLFGETLVLVGLLSALLLARGPRRLGALAAVVAFSLLGVYVEAYHREPTDLQVRAHVVQLGRFPERPLRLLHMSDIQTCGIGPYEERVGHNPNFVANLVDLGAKPDLVLAGHTHGGQVVLPFFGAPYTKTNLPRRYASGLHDYKGFALHVSAGVGMERGAAPQVRFLCPPEICLLELH